MQPARNINNTLTGQIITLVCESWGVSRADLVGKSRRRPLPWARAQMCQYLRLYAGHDSVSCATILHRDHDTTLGYRKHYPHNLQTYISFRDHDAFIHQQIKNIIAQ